jgi:hypothetical protein
MLVTCATLAAACPSKPATNGSGGTGGQGGSGSGAPVVTNAKTCADVKAKVEQLYRAEAQAKEPKRVEAAVADNTTMVMNDCNKDPAWYVPCIAQAQSIAELEKNCVVPLDDEGTEGDHK